MKISLEFREAPRLHAGDFSPRLEMTDEDSSPKELGSFAYGAG
jgi:hypothetical protein